MKELSDRQTETVVGTELVKKAAEDWRAMSPEEKLVRLPLCQSGCKKRRDEFVS